MSVRAARMFPPSSSRASLTFAMQFCRHKGLVDGWLYWSVLVLALRATTDVQLAVKTAQRACADLWNS